LKANGPAANRQKFSARPGRIYFFADRPDLTEGFRPTILLRAILANINFYDDKCYILVTVKFKAAKIFINAFSQRGLCKLELTLKVALKYQNFAFFNFGIKNNSLK
jgi:hypothetical protein